jgi:hypothetical protein
MSHSLLLFPILRLSLFCFSCLTSSALAAPIPLFDGHSLTGWEGDLKWWRVQDGCLTGGSTTEKVPRNFFLATTRSFQNFDLRLRLKLTGDPNTGMINSGVQIRSLRVPNNTEMSGYQVDAGDGWWGKLYDESRRNKVIAEPLDAAAINAAVRPGDWNDYRILAEGPRLRSWINGVPALDYTETDPPSPSTARSRSRSTAAASPSSKSKTSPSRNSRPLPAPPPGTRPACPPSCAKAPPPREKIRLRRPCIAHPARPQIRPRHLSYNTITTGPAHPRGRSASPSTSARLRSRTRRRRIRGRRQVHRHVTWDARMAPLDDDRPRIPRRRQRTTKPPPPPSSPAGGRDRRAR